MQLARAWKNKHGVVMGGLLMDTLAYNSFRRTPTTIPRPRPLMPSWSETSLKFLFEEDDHDHYQALGSKQDVKVKKRFQSRAKTAYSCASSD